MSTTWKRLKLIQVLIISILDWFKTQLEKCPWYTHKRVVVFHYHNAPAHFSAAVVSKDMKLEFQLVRRQPNSPEMAPPYYLSFAIGNEWLTGNGFYSNKSLLRAWINPIIWRGSTNCSNVRRSEKATLKNKIWFVPKNIPLYIFSRTFLTVLVCVWCFIWRKQDKIIYCSGN